MKALPPSLHAGIDWLLSKLHANLSVILGDEMGLGKVGRAGWGCCCQNARGICFEHSLVDQCRQ